MTFPFTCSRLRTREPFRMVTGRAKNQLRSGCAKPMTVPVPMETVGESMPPRERSGSGVRHVDENTPQSRISPAKRYAVPDAGRAYAYPKALKTRPPSPREPRFRPTPAPARRGPQFAGPIADQYAVGGPYGAD